MINNATLLWQTCLQTDGKFTSDTAQDLQTRNVKSPVVVIESLRNLTLTPVRDFL